MKEVKMSKAEELSQNRYPTLAEKYAFIDGYEQAEKDNELTWEDVREMCKQSVLVEIDLGGLVSDERHYTEVLKRFKEWKEK